MEVSQIQSLVQADQTNSNADWSFKIIRENWLQYVLLFVTINTFYLSYSSLWTLLSSVLEVSPEYLSFNYVPDVMKVPVREYSPDK